MGVHTPPPGPDVLRPEGPPLVGLDDVRQAAWEVLDPLARDYVRSGARAERTLVDNTAAWERRALHYRVLVDVSARRMDTTLLGQPLRMPICVAPTAFHQLAHPDGERATAEGVGQAGSLMGLSTLSTTAMEDVCAAAGDPARVWFQLYVFKDRGLTRALVERAEAAGCGAIALTCDAAILGTRVRDVRNGFSLPPHLKLRNLLGTGAERLPGVVGDSGLGQYVARLLDPSLTWADVDWLRSITRLPVVVKGICRGDDAVRAVDHGAAAVWVSNHGGRQLDTAPATADVLEEVVQAVAHRAEVVVDGGIGTGTAALKALALGAQAVFLGRPILYGLALGGAAGVAQVLEMLRTELDEAQALSGVVDLRQVPRDLVRP